MALAWHAVDLDDHSDDVRCDGDPQRVYDALGEMLAALQRPAWHRQASCRGQGPEAWFVHVNAPANAEPARAICETCLVAQECRTAGIADASAFGIWGGLTESQRRALRVASRPQRHRLPAPLLLAFVTETPTLTWAQRWERWQDEHPEHPVLNARALAAAWHATEAERRSAA